MLTYEDVKNNSAVRTYIQRADESLTALGYTEHSFAHVTAVAENAAYILSTLGYPERTVELAKIAGFLHDIGNLVNRVDHSQSGAVMAFRILDNMVLKVDTQYGSVMDYFEIFMGRMLLCRKAAEKLGLQFKLMINEQQLI